MYRVETGAKSVVWQAGESWKKPSSPSREVGEQISLAVATKEYKACDDAVGKDGAMACKIEPAQHHTIERVALLGPL